MKETLFLPTSKFPRVFNSGLETYERSIVDSLNSRGHGRNIDSVRYLDLKAKFPHFEKFTSSAVGAICETSTLDMSLPLGSKEYTWVETNGSTQIQHRIRGFVVITDPEIKSRNNYVAQSLFPFLFAQFRAVLGSSSKLLSTMPIYLVCLLGTGTEIPPSVKRDFKFASAAGIAVLSPMRQESIVPGRSIGISELNAIQPRAGHFSIDVHRKVFTINADGLNSMLNDQGSINGSNEKFGMMVLVPAALVARRFGYSLDVTAFDNWLAKLGEPKDKGKIANLQVVGKYLRKAGTMNSKPQQIIFFGAPGTGKSYSIDARLSSEKQFRVIIHPEYSYSDFVGQLLPTADEYGNVTFSFVAGPFTKALAYAFEFRDHEVVLILEELSRGNVAGIFGDLFQLLDRKTETGNSSYPVYNSQIASCLPEIEENIASRTPDNIFLPANFSIFATVNTSDQNVMPMDTAFKRRFDWKYVPTTPIKYHDRSDTFLNDPVILLKRKNGTLETSWVKLYQNINRYILSGNSPLGVNEDKQVGQFFIKFDTEIIEASRRRDKEALRQVSELISNKLLMYLWEDVEGRSGISGSGTERLFVSSISSFGQLIDSAREQQVFSDFFLDYFSEESPGAL